MFSRRIAIEGQRGLVVNVMLKFEKPFRIRIAPRARFEKRIQEIINPVNFLELQQPRSLATQIEVQLRIILTPAPVRYPIGLSLIVSARIAWRNLSWS
jgi:hypothetical protein